MKSPQISDSAGHSGHNTDLWGILEKFQRSIYVTGHPNLILCPAPVEQLQNSNENPLAGAA